MLDFHQAERQSTRSTSAPTRSAVATSGIMAASVPTRRSCMAAASSTSLRRSLTIQLYPSAGNLAYNLLAVGGGVDYNLRRHDQHPRRLRVPGLEERPGPDERSDAVARQRRCGVPLLAIPTTLYRVKSELGSDLSEEHPPGNTRHAPLCGIRPVQSDLCTAWSLYNRMSDSGPSF